MTCIMWHTWQNLCCINCYTLSGEHHSTLRHSCHKQETPVVWRQEPLWSVNLEITLLLAENPCGSLTILVSPNIRTYNRLVLSKNMPHVCVKFIWECCPALSYLSIRMPLLYKAASLVSKCRNLFCILRLKVGTWNVLYSLTSTTD